MPSLARIKFGRPKDKMAEPPPHPARAPTRAERPRRKRVLYNGKTHEEAGMYDTYAHYRDKGASGADPFLFVWLWMTRVVLAGLTIMALHVCEGRPKDQKVRAKWVPNRMGLRSPMSISLQLVTAKHTCGDGWEAPEPRPSAFDLTFKG